jgi:hypothetical protein
MGRCPVNLVLLLCLVLQPDVTLIEPQTPEKNVFRPRFACDMLQLPSLGLGMCNKLLLCTQGWYTSSTVCRLPQQELALVRAMYYTHWKLQRNLARLVSQ